MDEIMDEINELLNEYCQLHHEIAPKLDRLKVLKGAIKTRVLAADQPVKTDEVEVIIRKGYTRASWNDDSLMGYSVVRPEILEFRKVTDVRPSVSIKVK